MTTRATLYARLEMAADKLSLAKDTMDAARIGQARVEFENTIIAIERAAYDLGVDMGGRDLPDRDQRVEETFEVYARGRGALL